MNLFGTIAEYNPFHYGHKYHLEEMRCAGATHIAVAMSGNFVQRGDCAIYSKSDRAKAALENGADLIIEIPSYFAMSTAQTFACAGVGLLDSIGVNTLSFGSECGDIDKLKAVSQVLKTAEFENKLTIQLSKGMTYAAARELALKEFSADYADIVRTPNNILAIEYITAIDESGSSIVPQTVKRKYVEHDSSSSKNNFVSASELRKRIISGDEYKEFMPTNINAQPITIGFFEKMILYKLRTMTIDEIKELPDISEGLENRIFSAVKSSKTLDELFTNIKSKRYTHARIRRIILSAFLGFRKNMFLSPQYIKVLGMNDRGKEILKAARKNAKLPITMRYSDINDDTRDMFNLESRCTDIYSLATDEICGKEMTDNIIIL